MHWPQPHEQPSAHPTTFVRRERNMNSCTSLLISLALCAFLFGRGAVGGGKEGLSYGFYKTTCPKAEQIVKEQVYKTYYIHGNSAISFHRNVFHDCSVEGCDASLLLESTADFRSEKESERNFGMRNFKYVNDIKDALEKECPGVVSCADLVVLSGRDGVAMLGGPHFEVKTGRRDTRVHTTEKDADTYLLPHDAGVDAFLDTMAKLSINAPQAIALIGSHTVGRVHCVHLVSRLYPTVDPTLNASYADYLKIRCPSPNPDPTAVEYSRNDRGTPMIFDNNYYKNVIELKGLLRLDNALFLDPRTKPYVMRMAQDRDYFNEQFIAGMSILTEHNVLTGSEGEIRKNCQWVN
ncbi:hypothetical protein KP509_15G021300 [Ceratopteris richardii]|uniref:Peroxidase n=2 Tax=Ceratopteris richardii TaxID=49495 RepID=A0A8T2T3B0_CERRI|nr:hypothetical protein KP509_15G021300 [Ceratopteris richardii]